MSRPGMRDPVLERSDPGRDACPVYVGRDEEFSIAEIGEFWAAVYRVHVFLCILDLFFIRYLSWRGGDQGITDERMMNELTRVRVALVSRSDLKKPELVVKEMTPLQARLFTKLDLCRYIKPNNF